MVFEKCPHCEEEVELLNIHELQMCPNCYKVIKPCALCDMDKVECKNCTREDVR